MANIQIKTPGKLYVAGEYAVVEPGYSAIITSVNLFIYLQLTSSEAKYGTIASKGFTPEPVPYTRKQGAIALAHSQEALKYVRSAMEVTEEYIKDMGVPLTYVDLEIHSELVNETGRKLGLGSSGAVTVATVKSLLTFYAVDHTDLTVFKLSVLSQLRLGIHSSFGDVAAIAYTGWIQYTSFDREAVNTYRETHSVKETVEWAWPYLAIESLPVSNAIHFLIGWTGRPASSDALVGSVQKNKSQSPADYQTFLATSQQAVEQLADALKDLNVNQLTEAIEKNRKALKEMGDQTGVLIETDQLRTLCEIARSHGGAAKTSGAGGGDSGIAFIFEEEKAAAIIEDWKKAGITHLPLQIYKN